MSTVLAQPLPLTLTPQVVGYVLLSLVVVAPLALWFYLYPYTAATLPFKNLRGPEPTSGFFGSLITVSTKPIGQRYASLTEQYGASTVRFRGLVGRWRIMSTDTTAIAHVLRHTGQWHRNEGFNGLIERMTGANVLCVEDEPHRRQRRILNSAFNGTSVSAMMPMFWEEAYDLKKNVEELLVEGQEKGTQVDMLQVYVRTAMDIIGRAGFNYYFEQHKVNGENPLSKAFNDMINGMLENRKLVLVQNIFPQALDLPTANHRRVAKSRAVLDGIARDIVQSRRAEIARDHISLDKGDYEGKDVISLCLRANMGASERDRMTEAEIEGQIGALMLAGNETSATALSWATLHLFENPDIQAKLRAEVMAVPDDEPSVEVLNGLPYLDGFVRELLRLDPPLPQVVRTAAVDCVVPLGTPVQGRDGSLISEIRVSKGTDFVVPISEMNRDPRIWGADADKFNPDRYDGTVPRVSLPGVWGGLLSFIGGPHHCLGFRFALLEIKAVLFVVLRNFAFEPVPGKQFIRFSAGIIQRSIVIGEESKGMQMPVIVRALESE
ncbi:cytochrome P450 [Cutaneotrichosporon oleaginosum]|uniref:Cytochrome P450 n=1 Tax=Cutaneotrichosporon oleaginosum TaxID=879819 RepID=A0A0J0XRK5_9TREE|nr:cytochrome P450 [Cutaneotrichosporon oleaginosum]KLT43720.1 cytochrome P450 [Cutaneotrichosporon oleaginosum]TXT05138.1 hypothetical protein COLE_06458 [Cutaneotrichosporon oleaginosum]